MSKHLQTEIEKLKNKILYLGAMVEESLRMSIHALDERNEKKAHAVLDDDLEIDRMEIELEEDCLKVLALHQPVAIDLRFIVAILKINNDLERIGDLAVNIAERAMYLSSHEKVDIDFDYREMVRKVELMVKNSLDSLVNMDAKLARVVTAADDDVDEMDREMFNKGLLAMKENPDQMDCILHYMLVARHLERIADHATNIAEDVIYMVEGEIVRHRLGMPDVRG
jgi:phosphate transport system protein